MEAWKIIGEYASLGEGSEIELNILELYLEMPEANKEH